MTAKERLAAKVEEFSEREAQQALLLLGLNEEDDGRAFPPAPPEIIARARRAIEQFDRGEGIPHEEVGRRFGLD